LAEAAVSRRFGEIRQIAFVVPDIDEAMRYWTETLGIGPFFVKRAIVFSDFQYRGHAAISPRISIALANSGALQIELIEQHDDVPSIYRDFLRSGRFGLQHVSAWLTCAEFDRLKETLVHSGIEIAQEGTVPSSGARVAYFATEKGSGSLIFEISDLRDPRHAARIQGIADASRSWDGTHPVHEGAA